MLSCSGYRQNMWHVCAFKKHSEWSTPWLEPPLISLFFYLDTFISDQDDVNLMPQVQDTCTENSEILLSLFLLVPCNKKNKHAYFTVCLLLHSPRLNVYDTKLVTEFLRELHQLHGKRGHQVSKTSSLIKYLMQTKCLNRMEFAWLHVISMTKKLSSHKCLYFGTGSFDADRDEKEDWERTEEGAIT